MAKQTRRSKPGEHLIRWFLGFVVAAAIIGGALGYWSAVAP